MIEKLYTTFEAAELLGLKPSTLRNKMSAREIAYIPGRPAHFTEAAIKAYRKKRLKRSRT